MTFTNSVGNKRIRFIISEQRVDPQIKIQTRLSHVHSLIPFFSDIITIMKSLRSMIIEFSGKLVDIDHEDW